MSHTSVPQVITFGEMLLRLSPPGTERLFQTPQLRTFWGGAEANVAMGLALMGTPSAHVTILPDHAIGDAARQALLAEGVDATFVQQRPGRMGAYFLEAGTDVRAIRVVYDRAHSAFASMRGDEFAWEQILRGARWLHLSGVTAALGDGPVRAMHAAIAAAQAAGVAISLDLNFRPALWAGRDPVPIMTALAAHASLLIGNPGAMDAMLGLRTAGTLPEPPAALAETARAIHAQFGITNIAITQREALSASTHGWQAHLWSADTGSLVSSARHVVQVTDRVGGGDSFVAALLHRVCAGMSLANALPFAVAASALKLTIPGDVNRVSANEVDQFLRSMPS